VSLVVIGMTRSAIVPFHAWLPNSMEAPTTVSAFLHAGIVNGAGVLLAKTAFMLVPAPAALTFAALAGAATAIVGGTMCLVRPETKRRLGWSTVAQMGFMLLQCGCGAFAAAIVHLIAHGGYKATAFLGAAGNIDEHKRASRRGSPSPSRLTKATLAVFALAPATLGIMVAWFILQSRLLELPAASLVIAMAWLTATSVARRCAECALDPFARVISMGAVVAAVPTYLVTVVALDSWLGSALPIYELKIPAMIFAGAACIIGLCEGLGIRPRLPDAVYTVALTEGQPMPLNVAA
jgi:NADH:ubiquinone oxidoreductase subunit 5 (subunit L)/multisubunit Na+/H+ antiporter MnhA subunit